MNSIVITEPTTASFTSLIVEQHRSGFGFVPFVGSGISAPSGILMGMDFTEYLAYTTYRTVAQDETNASQWDLRSNGWPKSPSAEEVSNTTDWFMKKYTRECQRFGIHVEYDENKKVKGFLPNQHASQITDNVSRLAVGLGRRV